MLRRLLRAQNESNVKAFLDKAVANGQITQTQEFPLIANAGLASTGTGINGAGFVIDEDQYKRFLSADPRNAEVLRRYLTSEDMNSTVDNSPVKYAIDCGNLNEDIAASYSGAF